MRYVDTKSTFTCFWPWRYFFQVKAQGSEFPKTNNPPMLTFGSKIREQAEVKIYQFERRVLSGLIFAYYDWSGFYCMKQKQRLSTKFTILSKTIGWDAERRNQVVVMEKYEFQNSEDLMLQIRTILAFLDYQDPKAGTKLIFFKINLLNIQTLFNCRNNQWGFVCSSRASSISEKKVDILTKGRVGLIWNMFV